MITPDKAYETYDDDPTNSYAAEGPRRFKIDFTAEGPMWDSTGNDNLSSRT